MCEGRDYQNVIRASKALSGKKKHECYALRLAIVLNQVLTSLCNVLKPEIHVNDTLCGTLTKRPRCGIRLVFWLHVFVVMPVSEQKQQQLHAVFMSKMSSCIFVHFFFGFYRCMSLKQFTSSDTAFFLPSSNKNGPLQSISFFSFFFSTKTVNLFRSERTKPTLLLNGNFFFRYKNNVNFGQCSCERSSWKIIKW